MPASANVAMGPAVVEALDDIASKVLDAAKVVAYDALSVDGTGQLVDPLDLISLGPSLDGTEVRKLTESIRQGSEKYAEFREAKENAKVTGNLAIELLDVLRAIIPLIGLAATV